MSIAEITLSITIAGILAGIAVPSARRGLNAIEVRAAREAVFGAAARSRSVAIAHGGASLVLDTRLRTMSVHSALGNVVTQLPFEFDVDILADASSPTITITYDALGIGRMASRTVRFQKGNAIAGLTFSSYGRVRRW